MREVDYDERQHQVYARARALTEARMATWMRAFAGRAPEQRPLAVLDLGSGTGRFTPELAETFGGPVHGVEPSERMRAVAEETATHPAVSYLAGAAESIPLPADSCDLVLLFLVLQHVRDQAAAAAEIRRVVRPGGRVLIRSSFPDRMPELPAYSYFPGARRIDEQVFPRLDHTIEVFEAAGLSFVALDVVPERVADSLAEFAERLRLRGTSTFERLTEEEIEEGFATLEAAVAAESRPRPVDEDSDLLIFERP
ncbi:MAG: class I SAM-dependent methyltransferase [Actinoplanes sp.]